MVGLKNKEKTITKTVIKTDFHLQPVAYGLPSLVIALANKLLLSCCLRLFALRLA